MMFYMPHKDPEKAKEWARRYYLENREKKKAQARAWYEANRERAIETRKAYAEANPEVIARAQQRYHEAHPGLAAARTAAWKAANPERFRENVRRNDAKNKSRRKARVMAGWVEPVNRNEVFRRWKGRCGICGELVDPDSFATDHIRPLSAGGEHSYANVQLAHAICNQRKGKTWPWP